MPKTNIKQTGRAKSPAESTGISTARPVTPPELPRTHDLIVDAVAELLTTGGHRDDVDSLLYAAMTHTRRRTFNFVEDQKEVDRLILKFVQSDFDDWKADLVTAWKRNRRPEAAAFDPKTITESIRANTRHDLERRFESFLGHASPEEIRLLSDVLGDWDSRHHTAELGHDEIYLGMAFEYQLNTPTRCYVRIPERMVERVEKYIDALRAVEDKAAA